MEYVCKDWTSGRKGSAALARYDTSKRATMEIDAECKVLDDPLGLSETLGRARGVRRSVRSRRRNGSRCAVRGACFREMALFGSFSTGPHARINALTYDGPTRGPVPIPPSERGLQTVVADPWFQVSKEGMILEGPAFERNGNLVFCDVSGMRVLRVTPQRQVSTVVTLNGVSPGGLSIRNDGPIFLAAMNLAKGTGSILAVELDGKGLRTIVPASAGYMPNDLVLDSQGGFYFSDFRGISTEPKRGAYYVSPDLKTITRVLPTLQWQTASPLARMESNCGSPSSAETFCTGSSWRTQQRLHRSVRLFLINSRARHRIRCAWTATAICMSRYRSRSRSRVEQERDTDRSSAVARQG